MRNIVALVMLAICVVGNSAHGQTVCKQETLDGARVLDTALSDASQALYDVDGATIDEGYGGSDTDDLSFQFYSLDGSALKTGTFDLGSGNDSNYATCEECLLVYQDFTSTTGASKIFYQSQGTLTINASTPPGSDPINLTWTNLRLIEVTIDEEFVSTPVPNGDCYDIVADKIFTNGFEVPPVSG